MPDPTRTLSPTQRRQLSRAARDAFPPMGVYAIRACGHVVVGSSRNAYASLQRAQFELRLGAHRDKALQACWNDEGPACFSFDVLELVRQREDAAFDYVAELRALEQLYREELATDGAPR